MGEGVAPAVIARPLRSETSCWGKSRSIMDDSSAVDRRKRTLDVATEIADRLVSERGITIQSRKSAAGMAGYAGIAVFMAAMLQVRPNRDYEALMHASMKASAHSTDPRGGLFGGLYGLLATCKYVLSIEPRYESLLSKCANVLMALPVPAHAPASLFYDYDLVSGCAGEVITLASTLGPEEARSRCDYLVWLIQDASRWRCPHPLKRDSAPPVNDLGMAHGLAGVLAALAVGAPRECRYDDAVASGLEYLCEQRDPSTGWPACVSAPGTAPSRPAWCYGTSGCAAAILSAAARLGASEPRAVALAALRNLAAQSLEEWRLSDHAICHGHSGAALIFAIASQESGDAELLDVSDMLVDVVLDGFDRDSRLGYRAWRPEGFEDCFNLLEGAAGIGLSLLTLAGACDPSWMTYVGLPPLRSSPNAKE